MFKKTRKNIADLKAAISAAFKSLIDTLLNLTLTIAANTATVAANTAEQRELRHKLATISEHTSFLATSKKNELVRAGHLK
jgi:hypothetical protein